MARNAGGSTGGRRSTLDGESRVARASAWFLLGLAPAALTLMWLNGSIFGPTEPGWPHASDLHTFWAAGRAYLDGASPYPRPVDVSHWSIATQQSFVYPPSALVALLPLALLSYGAALAVFLPLLAGATALALWLFGVRDWRCYGAVFLWPATQTAIGVGTLSPLLLLGVAAVWRWRDRRFVGLLVAAVVSAKLFLWPLVVWLWLGGRRGSALIAVGAGVVSCLLAWSLIGFRGLGSYASVLQRLSATEGQRSLSPIWLVTGRPGFLVAAAVAVALLAVLARSSSEETVFVAVLLSALVLSPIVWLHYFVLLAGVIALLRPRFGVVWLVPVAAWATAGSPYGGGWRSALGVALGGAVVVLARQARSAHAAASGTPAPGPVAAAVDLGGATTAAGNALA